MNNDTAKNVVEDATLDLISWIVEHRGCVDRGAFDQACEEIAHTATSATGVRRPIGLPAGLPTLDFALKVVRSTMSAPATLAYDFPRLSGARNWK